ncbi:possible outer membrane protein [Cytophaga hutchinsonii ATCC 33406]|uniref:Possible outer membrane protein n=3 Tax=Cytophaga hutchinsonii TaxID=985 RepID=A0A6N4SN37_CYTH3|nr:possible outer membrane protein [Cytophaga hutchinsonii ATCC 33406]
MYMRLIQKNLLFVILISCLMNSNTVKAQQLTLFNIDTTKYPVVKADFFALDKLENQITTLTRESVSIHENGIEQQVVKVVNPAAVKPKSISLVLTIDISESMQKQYMPLAKNAAAAIVNKLPLDISECAVTSFNDVSFINTDFTRDRFKLLQSIQTLVPAGGTDYNKGFIKSNAGGLDILKKGLHEKVLIFLTDGYGDVNPTEIIQQAKSIGAKVYVITLGMSAPEELKRIVTATNGSYYENVISEQEINAVYMSILYRSQGLTPSSVEWISTAGCGYSKDVAFSEKRNTLKQAPAQYNAPVRHTVRLRADVNTITFNTETKEIPVALKAVNGDFSVTAFNSSHPFFSLAAPAFPRTIKKDETVNVIVTNTGSITEFVSGRIELTSAGCQSTYIYFQCQPPSSQPVLNLVAPNGKETFYVGQDTLIRWSVQHTTAPVKISFSSNAGKKWMIIADSITTGQFNWKIPNTPGTDNLIKVEAAAAKNNVKPVSKVVYDGFTDMMNAYNLSPDGSRYISQTGTELLLHDTYTNAIINKTKNTIKKGYFIFSPDGKYLFMYDENQPIRVYDGHTFEFIEEWGIFKNTLSNYIEPYMSNDLSQYVARDTDGSLGIFNFKTGVKMKSVDFVKGKEITDFTSSYIVSLEEGDHKVWVWDHKKGIRVLEIAAPLERIVNAEFNADENVLIIHTWGNDGKNQNFTAYDLTGKQLYTYKNTDKAFMSLDTYQNYALCSVADKPALIEMNTGKIVLSYMLSEPVKFGWFVPFSNGKYILLTGTSSSNVYMLTSGIDGSKDAPAQDQSDAVFTILSIKPLATNIVFPAVYNGNKKDTVVAACIKNNTAVDITVKKISIEGTNAASFKLLNPITGFTIHPKSSQDIEIRFAPVTAGMHQAILTVITLYDTVRVQISGTGIIKPYKLQLAELNMGTVEVGKSKDTTFTRLLTNTSAGTLYITSMRLAGPDKTQFKIVSSTTATLASGASAEIKLNFSPTQRGRTSTQLTIDIKDAVNTLTVPVYAEAYLPRKYTVQLNYIDASTNTATAAAVTCIDRQSKKSMESAVINAGKSSTTAVYADRIYVFTVTKAGYKTVVDSVNLLKTITDNILTKEIILIPDGPSTPVTRVLSGHVFIKGTQSPLWSHISFYSSVNKTLIKKIESEPDGTYNITLPIGTYAVQVEKEGYVNENTTLEISNGTNDQVKNFELTPIKVGETIRLPHVYFARGGTTLLESSYESLDQLYTLLTDNPTMRIELLGYTDNQGDAKLNVLLSEQRVAAIKDYLVGKGIAETRIGGKGYGGANPIASNATEETRQLNRRVEFKIVSK